MFKKFCSCILIFALLAAAIPTVTFAGESSDVLQKLMEMRYINQLCGVSDKAAGWHEGMLLSHTNSQQMETALRSMLNDEILPTLEYLEETVAAQVAAGVTGDLADELRKSRNDCRALRDEVQAELDIIEYERAALPAAAEAVFDGTYLTANQAEAAARRTLVGVERLEDSMAAVSGAYPEWESEIERMRKLLCPDDRTVPATITPKTPLQSHIVGVRADYMNSLMAEARRVAAQENGFVSAAFNAENEVEIYAVPRDKILFDVRDENNNPISDARVVAWSTKDGKQYVGTYDADAEGYLFSTKSLGLEADGYLEIGYEIRRGGYENHFANRHLCQGGDIFHTVLKISDGSPYISGASINGEDMQWSQTDVYITDANDADQTVSVYLESVSEGASQPVTMFYNDRNGDPQQVSATASRGSDGRVHADFVGKWCQIFNVGDPVSFAVGQTGNAEQVESLLSTNEPEFKAEGGDKPRYQTNNNTLMARFLPSDSLFKVTFPEDVPIFGGSVVSLGFPDEVFPVTAYVGLDGTFLLLLTKAKMFKDFLKDNVEDGNWKTESQAQTDRQVNNAVEKVQSEMKEASSSFAKDENSKSKPFFDKFTAWWSLFFCAQGHFEKREDDLPGITGQVSVGFTAGLKAESPHQLCAAPPIKLNVGVSFGVGAMLYGFFSSPFTSCVIFDLSKLDVEFGAVSLLIQTSVFISVGLGIKLAQVGVKAAVSLNLALPLIAKNRGDHMLVGLDGRITLYGQLLVLHVDWLLVRVSWAYENGKSGPVTGYVIGIGTLPRKKASVSGFAMPEAEIPETGFLSAGEPVLGEAGTDSNTLDVDTSVLWNYQPTSVNGSKSMRVSSTLPKSFELYNGDAVDMTVWAENNRIMVAANGMNNARELVIPDDPNGAYTPLAMAKKGIESGAYKILDVSANTGDSHYDYIGSFRMPVEVAVVSVTYAKSFKTESRTIGEKTVDAQVPKETETLSMAIVLTMGSTTPLMLTTDQGDPAAYVFLNTTDAIEEVYPYPCRVHLKESPRQSGLPCIDTENSFGIVTGALFEDGSLASAFYYYGNESCYEQYSYSTFRILKTGTTEDIPTYIGVDEDGTVVSGIFSNVSHEDYTDFADGDDIDDFVLFDLADSEGEMVAFYLEKTAQEGLDALKAVPMKLNVGSSPRNSEFIWAGSEKWDFETDIPSTKLNIGKLINYHTLNATLYWYDTGLKKVGVSDDREEIARVRGVYFDWFHRKASKPFTIATLYGDDGDTGELTPSLAPLSSFQSGGQFYFARALEKDNQTGENDSLNWQQGAYMVYNAPISNVIKMRVISANAEYHAMSAGRSGNFSFTLLNDGNMPISSATMRVSRVTRNPDGSEKLETVAEYNLNPRDEAANSARFWSVDADEPDVRKGVAAVRQVDTLFDAVAGDPVRAANAANDNPRLLEAFLPETVFAYKGSIAIPEDWDGLQLLRAEIVRAYGPLQSVGPLGATRNVMYDMENGSVYGVDEEGLVSSVPLVMSGGVPLRVEKSQPVNLLVDTAEISLSCKLHEKNGDKYIAAAISQTGNTAMNRSTGNITLRAYINDETRYPSYAHTFRNHTTGDICLNLDAPVSVLTGGHAANRLTLVVTDEAEANVDLSLLNNYQVFNLNDGLKWRLQPTEQTVPAGGTAVFTAQAEDGTQPYTYRWYRIDGEKSYEVGVGDTLVLENCAEDMNGGVYCCAATDANGEMIVSSRVNLWVWRIVPPPTGDGSPLYAWIASLAASLLGLSILLYARRRRFRG